MNRKLLIGLAVVAGACALSYVVNRKPQPAAAVAPDRVLTPGATGGAAPAAAIAPVAASGASLPDGEYTCYGSGLRILIGMGFRVSGGRYVDLDGKGDGTVTVSGDEVGFRGGHLDGQQGRALEPNGTFRIHDMASCEKTA